MAGDATEGVGADVTFTDVPVTIDARVVSSARIVEVDGSDVLCLYCLLHSLQQRFEAVFLADVITGRERVGSVETNAERKLRADAYDFLEVLEAVTDAVALPGRVLQKNAQRAKLQSLARDLQTCRAQPDTISFARAARASRMHYEVINTEQQCPLDFFTKRGA